MISPDKRFDVVVIGSGVAGSIAVKELTERGLDVLLLEAGRDITESDFKPTPEVPPGPLDMAILPRAHAAVKKGQHIQSRQTHLGALHLTGVDWGRDDAAGWAGLSAVGG